MVKRRIQVLESSGPAPRRRRTIRRKFRRYRAPKNNKIHNFTRSVVLSNMAASTVSDTFGGLSFKLSDLPDYLEFANLFDKFRICAIKLEIVPRITSSDINPSGTATYLPNIHSVIDHNDVSTPGDIGTLMQFSNYKRTRGHQIHKRYFKPAVLAANYEGAVTTAYTSVWKRWLDTLDAGTLHYGFRYCIEQTTFALSYKVYAKFYIQCKDPK